MINIIYVSHESNHVLGSSKSLLNMISALKNEVDATVILPKRGVTHDFFITHGVKCVVIPFPLAISDKKGLTAFVSFLPRLLRDFIVNTKAISVAIKHFDQNKPDLIHSNSSTVDWGFKLSRELKTPHVWHLREFQDLDFDFRPFRGWRYLLNRIALSESTISVTRAIQRHFQINQDRKNAFCFFNAVRKLNQINSHPEKEKYFLLSGNLSKAKGLELAISAFKLFCNKMSGYRLLFVGSVDNEYKKHLEELAVQFNLNDSVKFLPYTTDIDNYFLRATAFLMCSKNEAMGRVTVEAMFNGCPVIGFNGGGTKEIIQHGFNGLLFNTDVECAEAMFLVASTDIRYRLIIGGHNSARQNFSEESYRQHILQVYSSVLSTNN